MGVPIEIVGSRAQDQYKGDYSANSDFFRIDDFIARAGYVLADFYFNLYREQYAELRAEKTDGLVTFDALTLNEQILTVKKEGDKLFAPYSNPIMSFAYSDQIAGVQYVSVVEPAGVGEAERISPTSVWQLKSVPFMNKVWFSPSKSGITLYKTGNCNVSKISVLYVPSASSKGGYDVPDVLVDDIINKTVAAMRELKPPVIKKTDDQNQNMVLESEINKNAVR